MENGGIILHRVLASKETNAAGVMGSPFGRWRGSWYNVLLDISILKVAIRGNSVGAWWELPG
jgi:hypothetical protein